MSRSLLIPSFAFDADHVYGNAVDSAGTASREDPDGREVRPATRGATNIGGLNPIPLGLPTQDVNVDIMLRSPGNPDVARWTWRNDGTSEPWRVKEPASVLHHVRLLSSAVGNSNRVSRPKLLSLASEQMLMVYTTGTSGPGGSAAAWRTWRKSARTHSSVAGWSASTAFSLTSTPSEVYAVDAVQFPDTGEIAVFVLGSSGSKPALQRLTSAYDEDSAAPLPWAPGPCRLPTKRSVTGLRSMAVEIMPDKGNRLAMLIYEEDVGLWSSYSDDRGVTWSQWAVAGQFASAGQSPGTGDFETPGGVAIARARNGTLVALAPCRGPTVVDTPDLWPAAQTPRMRLLFSDDGESWNDAINRSRTVPTSTVNEQADALCEHGINEGAVVLGDDGLVRLYACFHGDPSGDVSSVIRDELALLTLAKPDVSAADVGRKLTGTQADDNTPSGVTSAVTCSDVLEGRWDPNASAMILNGVSPNVDRQFATFGRMIGSNGLHAAGSGGGGLDDAGVLYRGPRYVDAVMHLGRIWLAVVGEATVSESPETTRHSLFVATTFGWTEQFELLATNGADTIASTIIRGRTYEIGWLPSGFPTSQGWSFVGTAGNVTMDNATGGLKIDTADTVATYHTVTTLSGVAGQHAFLYFTCLPTSGGSLAASNIAAYLQTSDGTTNQAGVAIRLTATSIAVIDVNGPATLASDTGLSLANGVEVKMRLTSHKRVTAVQYRVLGAQDPEDADEWIVLLDGVVADNLTEAAGTSEFLRWGNQTTTPAVSTWRNIHFNRGRASAMANTALELTSLAGATYPEIADPSTSAVDEVPAWDDGLRHGSRAPVVTAEPPAYISRGLLARWGGAAGVADPPDRQDSWNAAADYACDASRVRRLPVSNIWRSANDSAASYIVFDGGTDRNWNFEAIAFFRCNAPTLRVQFGASNGTWVQSKLCDTTDNADVRRDIYRRSVVGGTVSIEGAGANVMRLAGDSATPLTPHRYESREDRAYYVYSSVLNKSAKILDNDGTRLFLDRDMTGAGTDGGEEEDYVAIYADTVYFPLGTMGTLTTSGYRWMRIQIGDDEDLPEGYQQCGLIVAGDVVALSDPHPDWGWREVVQQMRGRTDTQGGYVDIAQIGADRRAWQFGFNFASPPKSRSSLADTPGKRANGWEKLLYGLLRLHAGAEVCALLPEYGNAADDGPAEFGGSTERVYPVRFTGDPEMVQVAYERCRTDNTDEAFKALAGASFEVVS